MVTELTTEHWAAEAWLYIPAFLGPLCNSRSMGKCKLLTVLNTGVKQLNLAEEGGSDRKETSVHVAICARTYRAKLQSDW